MIECIHTYTREPINEDKLPELMFITAEECAEVTQECMKILRFGATDTNIVRLEKELGDLMCMYELLVKYNVVEPNRVAMCVEEKREKLKLFSNLMKDSEDE